MRGALLWALVSTAAAALACSNDDSAAPMPTTASLATSEIVLTGDAVGNGSAVLVNVMVSSEDATVVALGVDDHLVASADDAAEQVLFEVEPGRYAVLLPTTTTAVTLGLSRAPGVVAGAITLPAPFALTVPTGDASVAEAITISWEVSDAGDEMRLSLAGPCVATPLTRALSADTGAYELQPGDVALTSLKGCDAAVELERRRAPVDLDFEGSLVHVDTAQLRTAALVVVP